MVKITKLVETPQSLLIFLTLLRTSTRDGILSVINLRYFLIFKHSLTVTLHRTPPIYLVLKRKNYFEEVFDSL